jgi:hypothetical protein
MVIVLDANPWNPIHHAWFQFSVNHAKEDICLDGGFEVYAFDRHNHELPPYGRCTSEKDGDWRWSVSDPARKMVFEHTWHIPLPEGVTVIQGAYVSSKPHDENEVLTCMKALQVCPPHGQSFSIDGWQRYYLRPSRVRRDYHQGRRAPS